MRIGLFENLFNPLLIARVHYALHPDLHRIERNIVAFFLGCRGPYRYNSQLYYYVRLRSVCFGHVPLMLTLRATLVNISCSTVITNLNMSLAYLIINVIFFSLFIYFFLKVYEAVPISPGIYSLPENRVTALAMSDISFAGIPDGLRQSTTPELPSTTPVVRFAMSGGGTYITCLQRNAELDE